MAIKSFNQRPPTLIDSGLDTPAQQCPREWMQFIVKECALIKMIWLNGWSLFALLWMELKNSTPTHSSTTSLCVILWHLIWCEWTNVRVVAGNLCDFTIALCHFTSSSPRFYYHLRNALGFRTRKLRYSFALLSAPFSALKCGISNCMESWGILQIMRVRQTRWINFDLLAQHCCWTQCAGASSWMSVDCAENHIDLSSEMRMKSRRRRIWKSSATDSDFFEFEMWGWEMRNGIPVELTLCTSLLLLAGGCPDL